MTSTAFVAKDITSITVGLGTCGIASGALQIYEQFERQIREQNLAISLRKTGCAGLCHREPMIELRDQAGNTQMLGDLTLKRARVFIEDHVLGDKPLSTKALIDPKAAGSPAAQYLKKQQQNRTRQLRVHRSREYRRILGRWRIFGAPQGARKERS